MPKLGENLKIGIDIVKVEVCAKSEYCAAIVTRAYRVAIDDYDADGKNLDPKS